MKLKYLSVFLFILASSSAFADQESAKARIDDCYEDWRAAAREIPSGVLSQDDVNKSMRNDRKRYKCMELQKNYEKKYGKYK